IPAGARFVLNVQVWYYDSDARGRPNVSEGLKGPMRASAILTPAPGPGAHGTSPLTAGPCRLELEPAHPTLLDRGGTAGLTIRIANRPADVLPRLVLADSFPDAPALGAELTTLLNAELKRSADPPTGGGEVWRTELALQLEPEARRLLWERSLGGPLE